MNRNYDALVVGAGASGLQAGRMLATAGLRVAILEARLRVGGRIYTHHMDYPLELGAEFVHGLPAASWSLITEAGLATSELKGRPFSFEGSALQSSAPLPTDATDAIEEMSRWWNGQSSPTDISFAQYLVMAKVPALVASRAIAYVEGFNAADHTEISVAALARQQLAEDDIEADRIFHLRDGYDALASFLAEEFRACGGEILLGHEVNEVDWAADEVLIRGVKPHFVVGARHAVITLPLGVLKSGHVRFSPDIPAANKTMQGLAMGAVRRISMLFDRPFWLDAAPGLGFLFSRNQQIPTWWTSQPNPVPLITGWIGGARAIARVADLSDQQLLEAALGQLSIMFRIPDARLRSMLQHYASHDWSADPYSRGAYSYAAVHGLHAAAELARPMKSALFFAGEHTDPQGHWGTVHAALASGVRAAEQILVNWRSA